MRTLRAIGYNAIDVYFPWNYHEIEPGKWDFSGERDAGAFLLQAKEEGLWVVARPGPYICSEWDGGSFPAWLSADGIDLRENTPQYLRVVQNWYSRIMPIIAGYQMDQGGTVILIQIENELDFYNCADRAGMMVALRDMALAQGITVPLVACAGQGDIQGATGGAAGVVPVCNFYFDDRVPKLEERIRHYDQLLRKQGYPLCIIETNRSHVELRRLIAGGAKLVGPYLQTGGTNFGFTTSITNWGNPLSFMTSYYDLGGMISPGGKVRPESQEAVILMKMIVALGPALALSTPRTAPPVIVKGIEGQTLALDGGGYLVGLPNTGEEVVRVTLGEKHAQLPVHTELKVAPNTCPFVLMDSPLSQLGITGGRIAYATAELVECLQQENVTELTFAVDDAAELMVEWSDSTIEDAQGWQIEQAQTGWRFWTDGGIPAGVVIKGKDGKRLILKALDRTEVGDLRKAGLDERLIGSTIPKPEELDTSRVNWHLAPIDPCGEEWFTDAKLCRSGKLHLEENNIFRGFGWYRAIYTRGDDLQGFLICSGSDVLSLYLDAHFLGTVVPGGGEALVLLSKGIGLSAEDRLVVRAEIWGHANFDDHRLPALRLKSLRGMSKMIAVRRIQNITANWFYQHRAQVPVYPNDPSWPLISFGGWSTTDEPSRGIYYQEILSAGGMDACILHFPGLQASAQVFIDEQLAGLVTPFNPYVDLRNLVRPGESARIAVAVEQNFRRPAGQVLLYQGESIGKWDLAGWDEDGLARLAQKKGNAGTAMNFPVKFVRGEMAWLHGELPLSVDWERGFDLQLIGHGVKASVMIGRHLVGRVWLPSEMRPRMTGGADDRVVLPAGWLREAGGKLHLLLESVSPEAELQSVKLVFDS